MTDEEYERAMAEIDLLIRKPALSPDEAQRLAQLADQAEAYEAQHWTIGEPTAEEAAAFRREQEEG